MRRKHHRRAVVNAKMECVDWGTFALLASGVVFIFADQNLMAPNLTQVRETLHLTVTVKLLEKL